MSDFLRLDLFGDEGWLANPDWRLWGLLLLIGLPLALLVSGEIGVRLRRRGIHDYDRPFHFLRNFTLPLLFVELLIRKVIGYDGSYLITKLVDTASGITAINTSIAFFNVMFFGGSTAVGEKVPKLFLDILRLLLVVISTAIVISLVWGVDLGRMLAALGVGSLVIGLALQDTLSSLFMGLALLSARNIKVGDWIEINDNQGVVLSMSWRSVVIRARSGDNVIIPNSVIAKTEVKNFVAEDKWHIVVLDFELSYDHPPETIIAILVETGLATPSVLHDPKPQGRVLKYDDHAIRYVIRLFVRDFPQVPVVRADFQNLFWYAARRSKLIFPGRYHQFYQAPEELVPPTYDTPHALAELLVERRALPRGAEEIEPMLEDARHVSFRSGETIIAQGEVADDFLIIVSGHASSHFIDRHAPKSQQKTVKIHDFGVGQFIVFKTLFNSGKTPFMIKAEGHLEAVAIPGDDVEKYLARDVDLAHEIQQIISAREEVADRILAEEIPGYQDEASSSDRIQLVRDMMKD